MRKLFPAGCGIYAPQGAVFLLRKHFAFAVNFLRDGRGHPVHGSVNIPRRARYFFSAGAAVFLFRRIAKALFAVYLTTEKMFRKSGIGARKLVPSAIRGGKPSGYSFHGSLPRLGKLADFTACRLI